MSETENLATFLVGSHLYGLTNLNGTSDMDLLEVYRRPVEEYLVFENYEDTLPTSNYEVNGLDVSRTRWDVRKFTKGCMNSSFGCFEAFFAEKLFPYDSKLLNNFELTDFKPRVLSLHCLGILGENTRKERQQRGYMKALHYLMLMWMYRTNSLPPSLNAYELLDAVALNPSDAGHVRYLFDAKRNGHKDLPFLLENVPTKDDVLKMPVVPAKVYFLDVFRKLVME